MFTIRDKGREPTMHWNRMFMPVCVVLLTAQQIASSMAPAEAALRMDKVNHVITVSPSEDADVTTTETRKAIDFLRYRDDQDVHWILKFQPGKYYLKLPLYSVGMNNVDILSDPANPAQIIKSKNFAKQDYLFYTRMSHDVKIRGFEFYGRTDFSENKKPVWGDQGVFFGSCKNVTVDSNKFFNFGNAALRVTTSEVDPIKGINSFNTTVTNNTFNNIYQISTSSNDKEHGATSNYRLENNTFYNLRGSVKFASRTDGARGLFLNNNTFNGGDHYGFEIDNYDNIEIRGNTIQNIASVAINLYTAGDKDKITKGFPWGSDVTIAENTIKSGGRGIRYCHEEFFDGYQSVPRNVVIKDNTLNTLKDGAKNVPAIAIIRGKVDGLNVSGNKLYNIASKNYLDIIEGCTNVTKGGNLAEGEALDGSAPPAQSPKPPSNNNTGSTGGTQKPPASSGGSTSSTSKPAAPSNLRAQYDGNLAVKLAWTDNASNESAQEIWGGNDGKKYSLIAKLYANKDQFTHKLRKVPVASDFYYVVKAVNKGGASTSNAVKVNFHQTASK
jgi:hypothetical protein